MSLKKKPLPYIVTITGPSCAGKTTMEKMLIERGFASITSTATRAKREGEAKAAYHFVSRAEFKRLVAEGCMVEHVEFEGNRYGTTITEFSQKAAMGMPIVVVVEPEGRNQIRAYCKKAGWQVFSVYVDNPPEVIARRFMNRAFAGGDPMAAIQRLSTMMTKEVMWRAEALEQLDSEDKMEPYDLMFFEFGPTSERRVLWRIVSEAQNHGYLLPFAKEKERGSIGLFERLAYWWARFGLSKSA